MKLEFKDIINKEQDKSAIVIGNGPSLEKHIDKIKKLQRNCSHIIIACNDIDLITDVNPDYWVVASSMMTILAEYSRFNKKKCIVVYADSADLTPRDDVDSLLNVDYLPYDQRHFNNNGCGSGKCCDFRIKDRLTIQEELQKYTSYNIHSTHSGTVAVQMLSLAVLLGCKNIYVSGVDLNYSKGYAFGKLSNLAKEADSNKESFKYTLPSILDTIKIINDSANNINTNIFCIDKDLHISTILKYNEL